MNQAFYRYLEVSVYAILNFLPLMVLALLPFRHRLRFSAPITAGLVLALTAVQIAIGLCASFFTHQYVAVLSPLSTVLYAAFYFLAVKTNPGKAIFTLLMLSNIANLIVVSSKCMEGLIFGGIALESYRWTHSLCMAAMHLVMTLPLGFYMHKWYTPTISKRFTGAVWRYLWLIPATFYYTWYTFLYGQGADSLEVALQPMSTVYLLIINMGALLIYHTVLRLIKEQEKNMELEERNHQLTLQGLQYENLREKVIEARHAKHDLRHHITLMKEYLREGKYEELERYLNRYQNSMPDDSRVVLCKNYTVNTLLLYFAQQAKSNDTDFDVRADIDEGINVADNDLSVLLGNLLENAVHACAEQTRGERRVILRAKADKQNLFIAIDNSFSGSLKRNAEGDFLSTKQQGSGLGLVSVRRIAERYGGMMEIETKDGLFCVSVMLTLPQDE